MTRSQIPALQRAFDTFEAAPTDRRNAHLADYSFRFDADAPRPAVTRPDGPGDSWTLAQTLQEIRFRNARLVRTTRGLRVRHAHRMLELSAAVRRHAEAVDLWLDLDQPAPAHDWDDEVTLQAAWLRARLASPQTPLVLRPGVSITDWPTFSASVEGRLVEGPDAPCADGLRRDLRDLYERYAQTDVRPFVRRAAAKAA
ncbi:hypothetical protein [Rubrivirga marina]|uniref:Uncharacterized protein n=1 Tax=Rubrivirga marina TaxID=1196024 RepID=A0A271J2Z9_9BACT|nr:hypothetical protein [Rubrivirga marina]PAP77424.1 hypothetical protein BSZ37_13745 [Rubrivirga marina]